MQINIVSAYICLYLQTCVNTLKQRGCHPYSGLQTRDLSGEKLDMLSQICASGTQMNYLQNVARLTLLTIYFANIH